MISHTSVEFSHSASVLFCGLLGDNGVEMGELQHFFLYHSAKKYAVSAGKSGIL